MTMSFGSKPTVLKELCSLSQTISMSIMSLDLWKKANAAFPVKIKSMSLRKAILSFSTLGTIIPASNSVLSAGSVEGMCQKLPGHVQDFHLRERAHGAHQKRTQDFSHALTTIWLYLLLPLILLFLSPLSYPAAPLASKASALY